MSYPANDVREISADDALPPVEPPNAVFILQLFVVPAIIVLIIITIWWMFSWLAQRESDPQDYVRALRRNNQARWQAAVNLAGALQRDNGRGPRSLRFDATLARELAGILRDELKTGSMEEGPVRLRMYLCRALGEFAIPEGLPQLIEAIKTQRDPRENDVRRWALQAVALLQEHLREYGRGSQGSDLDHPQLDEALLGAARDSDPLVRSAAAFTLGVLGEKAHLDELHRMLSDTYPDVRFNAATGLARYGDAAAVRVLSEMLDPREQAGVNIEAKEARDYKRAMIQMNALEAVEQLAAKNSNGNLEPVRRKIERLLDAELPRTVRVKAAAVLNELKGRAKPPQKQAARPQSGVRDAASLTRRVSWQPAMTK